MADTAIMAVSALPNNASREASGGGHWGSWKRQLLYCAKELKRIVMKCNTEILKSDLGEATNVNSEVFISAILCARKDVIENRPGGVY